MATTKDLAEAHACNRRRLVTAFVSGAPGGREVEPPRSGRSIVGGLALAVLLIAGAAVVGVLSPRPIDGVADLPPRVGDLRPQEAPSGAADRLRRPSRARGGHGTPSPQASGDVSLQVSTPAVTVRNAAGSRTALAIEHDCFDAHTDDTDVEG